MEFEFKTPTQVWEGFNPIKEPLEASLLLNFEEADMQCTEYLFTSETIEDEKLRVWCKLIVDKNWKEKHPVVLVLPSFDGSEETETAIRLVENGYGALIVDYNGKYADNDLHTIFPKQLDYAKLENAKSHLLDFKQSANDTPWFVWAKICRRALSFTSNLLMSDSDRIAVLGIKEGAQLAWILAGCDGRVKTAIPILGGGYLYEAPESDDPEEKLLLEDKQRIWTTGIGAETYARSISCPILYITASNNGYSNIDRASNILDFVPIKQKALLISERTSNQITLKCFESLINWLKLFLDNGGCDIDSPQIKFKNINEEFYVSINHECDFENVKLFYSKNVHSKTGRDWNLSEKKICDKDTNDLLFKINIENLDFIYSAFATFEYKNGLMLSTPVESIKPTSIGIDVVSSFDDESARILYNYKWDLSSTTLENDNFVLNMNELKLKEGPFGISGLCTDHGNLVSYRLSCSPFAKDVDILLKMDLFAQTDRTFNISLYTKDNERKFTLSKNIKGANAWQKVSFKSSDFKSATNKSLTKFSEIEKTVFENAENIVFNNILFL